MCRNIKTLFNFEPPATKAEIQTAAIQFVRKVSGKSKPSTKNSTVIEKAADDISVIISQLLESLVTSVEPKNRQAEDLKVKAVLQKQFAASN